MTSTLGDSSFTGLHRPSSVLPRHSGQECAARNPLSRLFLLRCRGVGEGGKGGWGVFNYANYGRCCRHSKAICGLELPVCVCVCRCTRISVCMCVCLYVLTFPCVVAAMCVSVLAFSGWEVFVHVCVGCAFWSGVRLGRLIWHQQVHSA